MTSLIGQSACGSHDKLYWFYFCILCWRWVFYSFLLDKGFLFLSLHALLILWAIWLVYRYIFLYTRLFNSLISISLTSLYLFIVPCHCSSLFMNQLVDVLDCLYRNKKCRTQKYNQNCEVIPGQFCLSIILHSLPQMKFSYKVYTHTCEILFKDAQREKEKNKVGTVCDILCFSALQNLGPCQYDFISRIITPLFPKFLIV